jgi:hypothetical protein
MFGKVICLLFGHKLINPEMGVEACDRCDAVRVYYDGEYFSDSERYGLIEPLRAIAGNIRRWSVPRCDQCGRLLLFRRKFGNTFCSDECMKNWLPF